MRIRSALFATALIAVSLVAFKQPASAADALSVPKTTFPVCSATRVNYCVESVTIQSPGGTAENLTYQANGTALAAAAPAASGSATPAPAASGAATPAPSAAAADPGADLTDAGAAVFGVWTSPDWVANGHSALGYSGLVVDARAVNAFDNHLYLQVKPGKVDAANKTTIAIQKGSTVAAPAQLSMDDVVSVKIRVQNFQAGVSMGFGNNVLVNREGDGTNNTLTISGSATPIAMAKNAKDCEGEAGVALYTSNSFGALVLAVNDPTAGFGIDGVSGDMTVSSNGICNLSTPVWDEANKTLNWTAAAPHFAADGKTVNQGFYKAMIPVADAKLLWGLTNPNDAATALQVSMTTATDGTEVNAVKSIAVKNNFIIISSTGYQYSKPTFKIKRNPAYKPSGSGAASGAKKTITCVKGKVVKSVPATAACPKGYTKK